MGWQLKDFSRQKIKCIAEEYANTELEFSASYFCEHYNMTRGVFYALLRKAIIESIVSKECANKIAEKSAKNAEAHGGKGGRIRVEKAHEEYLFERVVFEFTKNDRRFYALDYADSYMNVNEFCKHHCIADRELFDRTLTSAIVDGLVSDAIVNKLREKSVKLHAQKAEDFYDELAAKREEKAEIERKAKKARREKKNAKPEEKFQQLSMFDSL